MNSVARGANQLSVADASAISIAVHVLNCGPAMGGSFLFLLEFEVLHNTQRDVCAAAHEMQPVTHCTS